jgi:hypothetical protein
MTRARILADYVSSGDELAVTTATAGAALPKAGGAMTGAITTNSTFDGVDIAARDAIHAPLAGPTFTGTVAIPNVANLETAVVANTAKVTNATHTGAVTGGTSLTIANDAVDSQHYAAGSIDNEHLADDAVGSDELANDVVINTSGKITTTSDYLQRGTPAVAWDSVYKTISNGTGWAVGVYDGSQDVRMCNNLYYGTSQFRHAVGTNPASIIQQNNNGVYVSFSPSTAAGTAAVLTTAIRIDADGLKFNGDSAAANALDDYEEGTWTPTDASGAGLTLSVSGAFYIKVGALVHVNVYFSFPSTANTAPVSITGLPFTAGSGSNYSYLSGRTGLGSVVCQISASGTNFDARLTSSDAGKSNAQMSTTHMLVSGTYRSS